ncbi:MAG: hypothetical protein JRD89_11095 [Deltaproteobacteria bacterium]|nr:hypothetical protein [Deltaproteobacteria bacterium]
MQVRVWNVIVVGMLCVMLSACGELRFSRVAPGIDEFHPERICVLPVNAGVYTEEAGDIIDGLIVDIVKGKGWFSTVVSPEEVTKLAERDGRFKDAVTQYLAKLKMVHYSDPDMSRYIGTALNIDALLVVDVDFWNYTTQGSDKLAKAGFSMDLVAAQTGEVMWKASHCDTEDYKWFKPNLASFARGVAKEMISHMPR